MKMILEWKHVTGKDKNTPIVDINFALEPGYLMGLAGANGAGKTTLLHCMLDGKKRYQGEILFNGQPLHENHADLMNQIGFIADENEFFKEFSGIQNVRLLKGFYRDFDEMKFKEMMKQMDVSEKRQLQKLSRGEYLKFQTAFAMAHGTKLYLIDEATSGMDPIFRKEYFRILREILAEEDTGIVMTTHLQGELREQADYVGMLENGIMTSFQVNES